MLKEIDADLEIHCLDCVQDRLDLLHRHILAGIWFVDGHPVDDQTFDVVVAGEFLEHLYPADVDKKVCDADAESTLSKACTEEMVIYGVSHLTQHFPKNTAFRMKMMDSLMLRRSALEEYQDIEDAISIIVGLC